VKVNEYLETQNISAEELASVLAERLNRNIQAAGVLARGDKDMPKVWAEALGIEFEAPDVKREAEGEGAKPKPKREGGKPPAPTPELNLVLVEQRVAAIYSMVGKGVAKVTDEPRYAQAFDQHADGLGKAWAELAKHDKHVATVLQALTAGGPWGEVLWLHMSLGFSLVIISGKVEIPGIFHPIKAGEGSRNGSESPPDNVA
jgi:hypothetical protein